MNEMLESTPMFYPCYMDYSPLSVMDKDVGIRDESIRTGKAKRWNLSSKTTFFRLQFYLL